MVKAVIDLGANTFNLLTANLKNCKFILFIKIKKLLG